MYALILLNEDELKNFSGNLNFIKSNANYLNFSPIVDGQEKISKIKPLELQTLNLETKVYSLNDNIDNLITNYTQSVNIINEKLAMYNEILKGKE